ncbi:hypothetical protein MesoLj113a_31870 [Mesorhizobium sp. 113-1-2]|uniref:DUF2235 domain-containing protein n=1 Tax=Mesorhizobium sp. 113-1-2 TaxID=2744515 RepID=UPI00081995F7|nr:DUF2235 domain-containing protein [Mesorhizobium sp. 113-1-2]BAV46719.1 Uncharacterized protein MLTONO_1816 [Mesorhizobium loti]BCG72029.1 hypothetical protein MesoLj113a_31870 [Mesorhizobium sp. 113-1-2]
MVPNAGLAPQSISGTPKPQRIIVLLDGTWNDADIGPADTNIVRLRDIIARTLGTKTTVPHVAPAKASHSGQELVKSFSADGRENIVFYERGVGTGAMDRFRGGVFGEGLGENVRRAYKFLSYHYKPDDEIFVFGFSRGAYTARSLVGYLAAAGLLKTQYCTDELEAKAWGFYRTAPNDRQPGAWMALQSYTHDVKKFRIECTAVFETVGALGVPLEPFWRANRDRYAFHDVNLASITNLNLHAIALDEHRQPFQATIWRKPQFKQYATTTEQVWFVGSHSDIGGSYIPEELRSTDFPNALDDITLDWMIRRLKFFYKDFPIDEKHHWKEVPRASALATQHDSRTLAYKIFKPAFRSIANKPVTALRFWQQEVCRDRHADPIAEMVHVSAIERLGQMVLTDRCGHHYRPPNLLAVWQHIEATYQLPAGHRPAGHIDIFIVDWDGKPVEKKRGSDLIAAANSRLGQLGRMAHMVQKARHLWSGK